MKILIAMLLLTGCLPPVQLEPVTIKPIHVIVDLNIHQQPAPNK